MTLDEHGRPWLAPDSPPVRSPADIWHRPATTATVSYVMDGGGLRRDDTASDSAGVEWRRYQRDMAARYHDEGGTSPEPVAHRVTDGGRFDDLDELRVPMSRLARMIMMVAMTVTVVLALVAVAVGVPAVALGLLVACVWQIYTVVLDMVREWRLERAGEEWSR